MISECVGPARNTTCPVRLDPRFFLHSEYQPLSLSERIFRRLDHIRWSLGNIYSSAAKPLQEPYRREITLCQGNLYLDTEHSQCPNLATSILILDRKDPDVRNSLACTPCNADIWRNTPPVS